MPANEQQSQPAAPQLAEGALGFYDTPGEYFGQPVFLTAEGNYFVEGYNFNGGYRGAHSFGRKKPGYSTTAPTGFNDFGSGYSYKPTPPPSVAPSTSMATQAPAGTTFVNGAPYAPGMAPGGTQSAPQQSPQYSQSGFTGGVAPVQQPQVKVASQQASQPIDYTLKPGESIEAYNQRIAQARGYDAGKQLGVPNAQQPQVGPQAAQGGALNPTGSIVDTIVAAGGDPSFAARQQLAKQFGVGAGNYTGTAEQNIELEKRYVEAFNKTKGLTAPSSPAEARTMLQQNIGGQENTPESEFFSSLANQSPIEAMLFQQIAQLESQTLDRQSYAQMYAEEMAKSGIQPLQTELAQTLADIRMTEENVREELAGGGGLVLEAQARGIAAVRTKALLTKAEQLSNIIDSKNEYIDRVIQLTGMDRAEADSQFDRKMGLTQILADYTMKMQDRARESYRQTIADVGYDGLVNSISSQQELNSVARSLGMTPETLMQLSTVQTSAQRKEELDYLQYQLSVDKFAEDKRQFGMSYALEQQKLANQQAANALSPYTTERATRNLDTIADLKGRVGALTVGASSLLGVIPGTPQYDFASDITTLKANIGFSELQEMRDASKTGGALGQVAVQEMYALQASLGNLDTGQSPAQFAKNLQTVEDNIYRWNAQKMSAATGYDYNYAKTLTNPATGQKYTDGEIYNYLLSKQ